jgi:hypothetical protein
MLKVMSDVLILKDIKLFQNESHYIIELEYKDLDNKLIKHTFEYHYYDNAINDFMLISKKLKQGGLLA